MKAIKGFEDKYSVTKEGRVWSHKRRIFLKPQTSNCGYARVDLQVRKYSIHRLVAEAFLPEVEGKKYVNHVDGDKGNNRASNLEWCTMSENVSHAYRTGLKYPSGGITRGSASGVAVLTEIKVRLIVKDASTLTNTELAVKYQVSRGAINHIMNGRTWVHVTGGRIAKTNCRIHLSLEKAREMRKKHASGFTIIELAQAYNVTSNAVGKVLNCVTWREPTNTDPQAS